MNAPLAPSHSKFGGSPAGRILACPGSVALVELIPESLRKVSSYAIRGSALHSALALLITQERDLDALVGETISGYAVTRDDVVNALGPALDCVNPFLDEPGASFYVEQRVRFPGLDDAFGTLDLAIRNRNTIRITDFKFGSWPVRALHPADDDTDIVNPQLAYYAVAARHSLPEFFEGASKIVLSIVQPTSIEIDSEVLSSTEITHDELDAFIAAFHAACAEALAPDPRLQRGPYCKFCPARPTCREHTQPLLDLALFELPTPATAPSKESYLALLAAGLNLADAVKAISKSLHDQAKAAIENGDDVPGFAITAGRAERHWHNESAAIDALTDLGLARADLIAEALRSPKQIELRARALGIKVPKELISSKPSGVSLVKAENARSPVLGRGEIVREFSEALAALHEGGCT